MNDNSQVNKNVLFFIRAVHLKNASEWNGRNVSVIEKEINVIVRRNIRKIIEFGQIR